eukprot:TRINITY_DN21363_c0_g1_i1.p2 TRINITY_DN21363_c0_g1~~TRINITY_DN21363_c0_g1_i1.p2  ORF type:complete len:106 (+),score=17.38 TRINITY_DN21363_c0_g1_i1:54-371(+)
MRRRPPRSTQGVSSAASDVYKRQGLYNKHDELLARGTSSIFSEFCKAETFKAEENFLSASRVRIPLFRAEGKPVDFVFLENLYSITLPMCESAISRQRTLSLIHI